jgi:predicted nucleic acid-binding protein
VKVVVDSNVLLYFYLQSEYTKYAEALYEYNSNWVAPVLWRSEFRNVLAGYMRRNQITFDKACAIQTLAENLLTDSEFEVDSNVVLGLVRDSDCSAYDCEFIALAIQFNSRLVTMDKKLLRAFPNWSVPLVNKS